MEIDEQTAYAIAAWQRFDDAISDQLLRAVAAAFALIVTSDGDVAASEIESFVDSVITSKRLPKVDVGALESAFRSLCEALMAGGDGRARALEAIAQVGGDQRTAELVKHAAHVAVEADGVVREAEKDVLVEIDRALGLAS